MSNGTRYETITADDRGGHLWVVTLSCLSFSTAALVSRGLSKYRFGFKFEAEDVVILASFALLVIQNALVITALTLGLGKNAFLVPANNVEALSRLFLASQVLLFAALFMIKVCMIFLISRVFVKSLRPYWIAFCVLGVASIITATAGCKDYECANSNPLIRWIIITVFDFVTEIIIILLPLYHLRSIHMSRKGKIKVMMSFSSRLLVIVFSLLTVCSLSDIILDHRSKLTAPTVEIVVPSVFQELELGLSFSIATILPCFRPLFQSSDEVRIYDNGTYEPKPKQVTPTLSFSIESVRNNSHSIRSHHTTSTGQSSLSRPHWFSGLSSARDTCEKKSDTTSTGSSDIDIRAESSWAPERPRSLLESFRPIMMRAKDGRIVPAV